MEVRIAEDGEILVHGPCVMTGYYSKPEQTREVFTDDGWFRTGDIGSLDADGYLYFSGRADDLVRVRRPDVELGDHGGRLRCLPPAASPQPVPSGPDPRQGQVLAHGHLRGQALLKAALRDERDARLDKLL